jgi:hypothetical protein
VPSKFLRSSQPIGKFQGPVFLKQVDGSLDKSKYILLGNVVSKLADHIYVSYLRVSSRGYKPPQLPSTTSISPCNVNDSNSKHHSSAALFTGILGARKLEALEAISINN